MATRYRFLISKWAVVPAVVALAVVAALLATALPVGAQTNSVKSYPENGTGRVASYSTSIPGGSNVYWYLEGTDAADFTLSRTKGGSTTLNFKKPPNYEKPRGGVADNSTCTNGVGEDPCDNEYKVTVVAHDGGGEKPKKFMVEVTVTNVDEPGSVTLTPIQPQTGIPMMAKVEDPDEEGTVVYKWAKSRSKTGSYTTIAGATEMMYTPMKDDKDYFIMVTARYIGASLTARSEYAVRATPADNKRPMFFDQNPNRTDPTVTTDMYTATRSVAENTPPGTPIGPPVTAYDPDGDMLTYKLVDGDDDGDDGDSTKFRIDPRTGQIMTKAALQYDGGDPTCGTSNACSVKVVATDSSDIDTLTPPTGATSVTVTINVTDVNEAPTVVAATETSGWDAMTVDEFTGGTTAYALLPTGDVSHHTYTATDPEDGTDPVPSSVEGPDGKLFEAPGGILAFKDCSPEDTPAVTSGCPNYEEPMDDGKDNVYEVDIVAIDSTLNKGMRRVTIKVSNVNEDGKVTFPGTVQPAQGERITAKLTDPDVAKSVTWQWAITTAGDQTGATPAGDIKGTNSATYTPKAGDVGATLTATASYTDGEGSGKTAARSFTANGMADGTAIPVIAADGGNTAPKFVDESTPPKALKPETFSIIEGDAADTSGVARVVQDGDSDAVIRVMDATGQLLRYDIEGTDRAMFKATPARDTGAPSETREIKISAKTELDHEKKSTLKITLRATDPFGQSATIAVTINVTDAPEAPKITGPKTVLYAENGKGTVATFTAKDPDEGAKINWGLDNEDGADHALFTINALDGVLTFEDPPDYEMPRDSGGGTPVATVTDNIYEVTVRATTVGVDTDDSPSKAQLVKVKVTDVPEKPEFAKSTDTLTIKEDYTEEGMAGTKGPDRPIGNPVTAMDPDTDPDADTTAPYFGADMPTYSLSGADAASFSIVPATGQIVTKAKLDYETKKSYMVTVTATDRSGGTDTIAITIEVLDVDEIGDIVEGDLIVTGSASETYAEKGTEAVATYTAEGEKAAMATWTLEGDDKGDFRLDGSGVSRMLKFGSSPDYEMPADADKDNEYMVTVKASYGSGDAMVMGTQPVTVMVTNEEEMGMVTFWKGTEDVTTATIVVGDMLTAAVMDPDGNPGDTMPIAMDTTITGATWQWAKSSDMSSWMDITGATNADYTVAATDDGMYLRATAMYDDGEGTGKSAKKTTMMVVTNTAPTFGMEPVTREVPENSAGGTKVGAPVTATDADTDDKLTYTLGGTDAGMFSIDNMGQIKVGASAMLNYEAEKKSYMVTVTVDDGSGASNNSASIDVTIMVTNVDEMGMVTLMPMAPVVGTAVTASLTDPDMVTEDSVTWQWSMSDTMDGSFTDIDEATESSYTPTDDDVGYYLRATATYTDGHGEDKTAKAETETAVPDPLVARYDADKNGEIDKAEVIEAINDYLFGTGADRPSKADVIKLINMYLFG